MIWWSGAGVKPSTISNPRWEGSFARSFSHLSLDHLSAHLKTGWVLFLFFPFPGHNFQTLSNVFRESKSSLSFCPAPNTWHSLPFLQLKGPLSLGPCLCFGSNWSRPSSGTPSYWGVPSYLIFNFSVLFFYFFLSMKVLFLFYSFHLLSHLSQISQKRETRIIAQKYLSPNLQDLWICYILLH